MSTPRTVQHAGSTPALPNPRGGGGMAYVGFVRSWLTKVRKFTLRLFSKTKHSPVPPSRTQNTSEPRSGFKSRGTLSLWVSSLTIERGYLGLMFCLNAVGGRLYRQTRPGGEGIIHQVTMNVGHSGYAPGARPGEAGSIPATFLR